MTCGSAPHLPVARYHTRTFSLYISMFTTYTSDRHVPVKRLQLGVASGTLVATPKKASFLRGPIPLEWLSRAAALPGKTLNVAIAVWWRHGMAKGKPFKLTQMALKAMNLERGAERMGLARLEQAGLIQVDRKAGQRPTISIVLAMSRPT